MKIYDCFMFYDEDMLLDIRLNILDKYVDYFVIVESRYFHNGKNRELKFNLKNYEKFKNKIQEIKTATLWKKKKSTFEPDYCAVRLDHDPWIVQPFEVYEELRIEDIKNKHQK